MKAVPFFTLDRQYKIIGKRVRAAIDEVCENSAYSGGSYTASFEQKFATYTGARYTVGVNSGTSALHLALLALGVGEGDEVIVPANTFIATAWAASYVGATPVFVDCDSETWNIDEQFVEKAITHRTKAIIGVHLYGQPFDVSALLDLARDRGVYLVEDCAQAHGATVSGKHVGTQSDIGCFSFYPSKNLGAFGEAGMITTQKEAFAERVKALRDHGQAKRYYHEQIGFNMRMDGIQSAVLSVKLDYLDTWNQRRREIAQTYTKALSGTKFGIQKEHEDTEGVFHLFVITCKRREKLLKHLRSNKIGFGMHYPIPVHLQEAYSFLGHEQGSFISAEYLADHGISLPLFPEMTDAEVDRVIQVLTWFK